MLFAIRYDEHQQLAGAALACDEMALGNAFWRDVYAGTISNHPDCQTAYVMVDDSALQGRLLALEHDDSGQMQCDLAVRQITDVDSSWNRAA